MIMVRLEGGRHTEQHLCASRGPRSKPRGNQRLLKTINALGDECRWRQKSSSENKVVLTAVCIDKCGSIHVPFLGSTGVHRSLIFVRRQRIVKRIAEKRTILRLPAIRENSSDTHSNNKKPEEPISESTSPNFT